jgi:methyl-accepting chemotaxis protein
MTSARPTLRADRASSRPTSKSTSIAATTKTASSGLAEQSVRLSEEIRSFLVTMRQGMFDRRKVDDPTYRGPERRKDRLAATASGKPVKVA